MFTKGKCDMEVNFNNGSKKIIRNVVYKEQGNWFHMMTEERTEFITNPDNILFVVVWPSKDRKIDLNPRSYGKEKKK